MVGSGAERKGSEEIGWRVREKKSSARTHTHTYKHTQRANGRDRERKNEGMREKSRVQLQGEVLMRGTKDCARGTRYRLIACEIRLNRRRQRAQDRQGAAGKVNLKGRRRRRYHVVNGEGSVRAVECRVAGGEESGETHIKRILVTRRWKRGTGDTGCFTLEICALDTQRSRAQIGKSETRYRLMGWRATVVTNPCIRRRRHEIRCVSVCVCTMY